MASTTIVSALVNLARVDLQYDDVLPIEDLHDFTQAPTGSLKKISVTTLFTTPTFIGLVTVSSGGLNVTGGITLAGGSLAIAGGGNITGTVPFTGNVTIGGVLEVNVAANTSIGRFTSTGGSGRSWDIRSNTGGTFTIVDVTGAQTWLSIAPTTGSATFTGPVNTTQLQMSTAISRIVPGATSLLVRNNADTITNFSITDGGAVTVPGTFGVTGVTTFSTFVTVLAGGLTVTSGGFIISSGGAAITGAVTMSTTLGVTGIITASAGLLLAGGTAGAGKIVKTSTNGTVIQLASGSLTDLAILGSAGSTIATVNAATVNVDFAGGVTVAVTLGVTGLTTLSKMKGSGSTPGVAATANAGSGASASISGTDLAGSVGLQIGTSPTVNASAVTITYASAYSTTPFVTISPAHSNAGFAGLYVSASSASAFSVGFSSGSVTLGNLLNFNFHVTQ